MTDALAKTVPGLAKSRPAQGMRIEGFRRKCNIRRLLKSIITNNDGRIGQQILPIDEFQTSE